MASFAADVKPATVPNAVTLRIRSSPLLLLTSKVGCNEMGSKVEADVAMCPLLSLFCREENRDGDTYVPYALHNY